MDLSVSVSQADVSVLDERVRSSGPRSRSAALQHAIRLLRHEGLEEGYAAAWQEWDDSGERSAWEGVVGGGLEGGSGDGRGEGPGDSAR